MSILEENKIDTNLKLDKIEENFEAYKYSEECAGLNLQLLENGYIQIRTVFAGEDGYIWDLYERQEEWQEIDGLIETFQKQFRDGATAVDKAESDVAGEILIDKFYPLFKKYLNVLTTGQINFWNIEQKAFVKQFMDSKPLKCALSRRLIPRELREIITNKFNFIVEGYGAQSEEEIIEDLHMLFFILAKRYKPMGKSFCCYIYNTFKWEVSRHIKRYQQNPTNFHYKSVTLDDHEQSTNGGFEAVEDSIYENEMGIPDTSWINGDSCSKLFVDFSPVERMIFIKYYLEQWNDSQISQLLCCHINTANQKRKKIVRALAEKLGIGLDEIKRHRKSGKRAILGVGA